MTLAERARTALLAPFDGVVSHHPYELFRVAMALLVLARTTDLLRPLVELDHHGWVTGLEYHPAVEQVVAPALGSPLLPGLDLAPSTAHVLVWARTVLAVLLLLGFRPRISAALLALIGGALLLADRYRYLHHLYLLWLSVAWLAIVPGSPRLGIERWLFRREGAAFLPRWPLSLWRLQGAAVYAAAGLAKLSHDWLSGKTLRELGEARLVGGGLWQAALDVFGAQGLAVLIAGVELGLPVLLFFGRTRAFAVGFGILFHIAVSEAMMVSTFSLQMILYLLLFLPFPTVTPRSHPSDHDARHRNFPRSRVASHQSNHCVNRRVDAAIFRR